MSSGFFENRTPSHHDFLKVIGSNALRLLLFSLLAAGLAALVTLFIPKRYQSFAIIFPPASNSIESAIENPNFGYDIEADRLMQILSSNRLQDSIVRKFDLVSYYELDTTQMAWEADLDKKYKRDIGFSRTPYMSILISAKTEDPQLSANIVNSIIRVIDPIRQDILSTNIRTANHELESEFLVKQRLVDSLVNDITLLRNETKNNTLAILGNQFLQFQQGKSEVYTNNTRLEFLINQYFYAQANMNLTRDKLDKARIQLNRPVQGVYVLDRGKVNNKKVSPSFAINMVSAFAGAFLLGILYLFIRHKIKEIREFELKQQQPQ
jgi:capsular polysaccharide biosynthesis protein